MKLPAAVGRAHHGGHRVDHLRQTFAGIAQRLLARALAALELALEQELLLAQLQQIARAGDELVVIDRALQEIGRAGLQRAQPEAALLVDRDDDDRDLGRSGQFAEAPDELRRRPSAASCSR